MPEEIDMRLPHVWLNWLVLGWMSLSMTAQAASPTERRYTTVERLELPRLRATHAAAVRYQESRRTLPGFPGFLDLRAILHAHAEDSTHTGGTRPEMLADAKRAGVQVILLTDHHRPPKDFIDDNWRGMREGVLFIPGSEARGFLIYPMVSVMARMQDPLPQFIETIRRDRGLMFLSHIEERPDHSMEQLDGLEIYNRHADAKKDLAGIAGIVLQMTDPRTLATLQEGLRDFPDEMLAAQCSYLDDYFAKWDRETKTRRLTGIAANDCHHNQVLQMKKVDDNNVKIGTIVDPDEKFQTIPALLRPGIRQLTKGRRPGEILAALDFDPYYRSFRNSSTHLLAAEVSESAVRLALRDGRAYVSHDWMCDPTGFSFVLRKSNSTENQVVAIMGDEIPFEPGGVLVAEFPVGCHIRLLNSGVVVAESTVFESTVSESTIAESTIAESTAPESLNHRLEFPLKMAGVYRVEGWLEFDGEWRPWLYSNPIYVR